MDKQAMGFLLIGFVWLLNFAISWWNAYVTGKMWVCTKQMGGWQHFMTWMGYLMSVAGFGWCFLIPLSLIAYSQGWHGFDIRSLHAMLNLGYLILAPVIVFAGFFIWLESLANAWRERTISSVATAGWNTYAQLSNMWDLFTTIGPAFENVSGYFSELMSGSSDGDDGGGSGGAALLVLIVALVAFALLGGFLLATAIVVRTARSEAREFRREVERAEKGRKR